MLRFFKKKKKDEAYTLKDLAQDVIAEASKRDPECNFIYDEGENVVKSTNDRGTETYLGNIFKQLKDRSPEERQAYIIDFFDSLKAGEEDVKLETLESSLLTRVRTKAELGNRHFHIHKNKEDLDYFEVALGEIFFELVVDRGSTVATLQRDQLLAAGGDDKTVLNIALSNLNIISAGEMWENIGPHIWVSTFQDDYDAARLICQYPKILIPSGFEGEMIAFMPSHSVCLITDKIDAAILQKMLEEGQALAGETRMLSTAFWQYKNGGWYQLELEPTHPAYNLTHLYNLHEEFWGYQEQQQLLERDFNTEGKDIFPASYKMLQDQDSEEVYSLSVLTKGIATLLPKTEKIAILDPDLPKDQQFLGMIPWDEFVTIIGPDKLKSYKSLVPVRYDFTKTPTEADFNKIKQYFA